MDRGQREWKAETNGVFVRQRGALGKYRAETDRLETQRSKSSVRTEELSGSALEATDECEYVH